MLTDSFKSPEAAEGGGVEANVKAAGKKHGADDPVFEAANTQTRKSKPKTLKNQNSLPEVNHHSHQKITLGRQPSLGKTLGVVPLMLQKQKDSLARNTAQELLELHEQQFGNSIPKRVKVKTRMKRVWNASKKGGTDDCH